MFTLDLVRSLLVIIMIMTMSLITQETNETHKKNNPFREFTIKNGNTGILLTLVIVISVAKPQILRFY